MGPGLTVTGAETAFLVPSPLTTAPPHGEHFARPTTSSPTLVHSGKSFLVTLSSLVDGFDSHPARVAQPELRILISYSFMLLFGLDSAPSCTPSLSCSAAGNRFMHFRKSIYLQLSSHGDAQTSERSPGFQAEPSSASFRRISSCGHPSYKWTHAGDPFGKAGGCCPVQ
ncbi:hypothetical protein BS50DRAFT_169234 [Corynespora cassiicola Philippines]|uniref:Uncharacterized protein n=1 Tax=Corynespora cassiicola Philippines TaxID=1448308 RepID=A0A2T2P554_CORCC|nr:hypothetical protein BS50DRAFT_169234 [Corynespora cassiicola Philippines]